MSELKDPFSQYLLRQYSESIFLNKDLDIYYIHGDLESVLSLPNAITKLNLERMLPQNDLLVILDGVRAALNERKIHRFENVVFHKRGNEVTCHLIFEAVEIPQIQEDMVLLSFDFSGSQKNTDKVIQYRGDIYDDHIIRLEKELKATKQKIKNLETDKARQFKDFDKKNRELSVGNEELQSTNEELQSVNEELHTVNAELQHKNIQLSTANNDINNFLKATNIGTIFLDPELNIRKFTPAIKKQFSIVNEDIGRSITTFTNNFKGVDVEAWCEKVFESGDSITKLVSNKENQDFLVRIFPYKTLKNKIEGVVIAVIDLSKTKSLLQKYDHSIREMAHKFDAIFKYSYAPILFLSDDGIVLSINRAFGGIFDEKAIRKPIFDLLPDDQVEPFTNTFNNVLETRKAKQLDVEFEEDQNAEKSVYRFQLIPIPGTIDPDKVKMVSVIASEITEEVVYTKALEKVKDTFMSFMENAQHQMLLLNEKGKIVHINIARSSPYTKEQLIGMKVYQLLPPGEVANYKKSIEEIFAGKANSKISFKYVRPDGEETTNTVIATPVIVGERVAYVALIGNPID